ncbi:hypothetical protein BC629DRAFT_1457660 [Irpex lacteus]|nr:hypothetical protein BC629DRAFT_1457660 [Irpex lacteus]
MAEEPSALMFLRGYPWFTLLPRSLLVLIDAVVFVHPCAWTPVLLDSWLLLISAVHHSLLVITDMVSPILSILCSRATSRSEERYGLAEYLIGPLT